MLKKKNRKYVQICPTHKRNSRERTKRHHREENPWQKDLRKPPVQNHQRVLPGCRGMSPSHALDRDQKPQEADLGAKRV